MVTVEAHISAFVNSSKERSAKLRGFIDKKITIDRQIVKRGSLKPNYVSALKKLLGHDHLLRKGEKSLEYTMRHMVWKMGETVKSAENLIAHIEHKGYADHIPKLAARDFWRIRHLMEAYSELLKLQYKVLDSDHKDKYAQYLVLLNRENEWRIDYAKHVGPMAKQIRRNISWFNDHHTKKSLKNMIATGALAGLAALAIFAAASFGLYFAMVALVPAEIRNMPSKIIWWFPVLADLTVFTILINFFPDIREEISGIYHTWGLTKSLKSIRAKVL